MTTAEPATIAEAQARLTLIQECPPCASCCAETDLDDGTYRCEECGLSWDAHTLEFDGYLEADAEPCGVIVGWGITPRSTDGVRYVIQPAPCPLPAGHTGDHHDASVYVPAEEETRS